LKQNTNKAKQARLVEGPVGRTLANLTGPMLIGIMAMIAFNLADTFFIGQLGTIELAAITFTFPVILILSSITQGLGVGASVVISMAIGEGDSHKFKRITTDSLILGLSFAIITSTIGLLTINPVFKMLGAETDVLPYVSEYMHIWYTGAVVVVVPMIGNAAIRATGDTATPAAIMMIAVTTNVILDPLLIFDEIDLGFVQLPAAGLGVQGAAIATVSARTTALLASLWVLHRRERMIDFTRPVLSELIDSWKRVLFVGIPAALTQMLTPISQGIITGLIATYGTEHVAGFGVASRIEILGFAGIIALSSALMPFVGQNLGANRIDRVRLSVQLSARFAIFWGIALFVILGLFREPIASVFNDDSDVIATIGLYLLIVPISYGLQNILYIASSTLNALNKPIHSTILIAIRMFALYVPLAIIGSELFGIEGIFGAAALASIITGIIAWIWLNRILQSNALDAVEETTGETLLQSAAD
jgi:putative MATE family efflux protein